MSQQIILRNLQRPKDIDVTEDIEWLGNSFGFSAGRDTEKVTAQILKNVLQEVALEGSTSTEKIAEDLDLSSQRVNYHLRTLMDAGFLFREKRLIFVRQGSVKSAVEEMRRDANRIFDNLSKIGEEIDEALGFRNRQS
ncbi:winged helix-turn-helix transcriptional regulator [Candidatus Woesearchaeota archaeon]|nr:winged helix-turn-helix transcriptional regulator [Candidatus Woesearchaeota archaeon]